MLEDAIVAAAFLYDWHTVPRVFERPISGEKFLTYVEQILVLTLSPATSS